MAATTPELIPALIGDALGLLERVKGRVLTLDRADESSQAVTWESQF